MCFLDKFVLWSHHKPRQMKLGASRLGEAQSR